MQFPSSVAAPRLQRAAAALRIARHAPSVSPCAAGVDPPHVGFSAPVRYDARTMLTRVHHVGLVVRRLEDGLALWQDVLGLRVAKQATVVDQGVRAALLPIGRSEIELLEPVDPRGGVAKFLERRGEGLHHVCFETPAVAAELAAARAAGMPLIDEAPRQGLAGMICFLHPKGTRGVLVEFATPPPGAPHHPGAAGPLAGLALAEVTVRSRESASAAELFTAKLGLAPAAARHEPGAVAAAVEVGGVRLRFVSADPDATDAAAARLRAAVETNGEGLAGLVLEIPALGSAEAALTPLAPTREAQGLRLAAERCHGVPLMVVSAR
jgi:methylmalonyl-CoA/ethylmalonyl-CoA epimerase